MESDESKRNERKVVDVGNRGDERANCRDRPIARRRDASIGSRRPFFPHPVRENCHEHFLFVALCVAPYFIFL